MSRTTFGQGRTRVLVAVLAIAALKASPSRAQMFTPVAGSPGSGVSAYDCRPAETTAIQYQGGPVMHGMVTVYFIYYGPGYGITNGQPLDPALTGPGPAYYGAANIFSALVSNIGGSPYYSINTTYSDSAGPVSNSVRWGGSVAYAQYNYGTALQPGDVGRIVAGVTGPGLLLPADANAVYLVLGDRQVTDTEGGQTMCSGFCAWHYHMNIAGIDVKYGFIGDPDHCVDSNFGAVCYCNNQNKSERIPDRRRDGDHDRARTRGVAHGSGHKRLQRNWR